MVTDNIYDILRKKLEATSDEQFHIYHCNAVYKTGIQMASFIHEKGLTNEFLKWQEDRENKKRDNN